MKKYESPSLNSVENLKFETVCAGSGNACPYGKSAPNPNYQNSECQTCLNENVPAYAEFKASFVDPTGMPREEQTAYQFMLQNPGVCPAGYSFP